MRQKQKLRLFTAFIIIVSAIVCAVLVKNIKPKVETITDRNGVTYVPLSEEGKASYDYVIITDAMGKQYAAPYDGQLVDTDAAVTLSSRYDGTFPYNSTTRADNLNINQTNGGSSAMTGEAQTKESTTSGSEQTDTPQTSEKEDKPKEYLSDKFIKLFNSNVFTMTFTSDDEEMGEVTMALQNNKVSMDVSMEGIKARAIIDTASKKGYMIIPAMRVYCIIPDDMFDDLNSVDMNMPESSEAINVDVTDVTIDGKDCVCEEFTFDDGSVRTFYFNNGNLIRMIFIEDGETTLYNISAISSDINASDFELPRGYLKIDLSKLQTAE